MVFLKKALGVLLILVGAVFDIFPLIPGILLIILGLELLGVRTLLLEWWQKRKGE